MPTTMQADMEPNHLKEIQIEIKRNILKMRRWTVGSWSRANKFESKRSQGFMNN